MLRAVHGQIKWAYRVAVTFNGLVVSCTKPPDRKWSLRGTVVEKDEYALGQTPLILVVPHQGGSWRWPIESLTCDGGMVTAALGPPLDKPTQSEEAHAVVHQA